MTDVQFGGVIMTVHIKIVKSQNCIFETDINLCKCVFFSPRNENEVKTWTKLVNRVFVDSFGKKTLQVRKYTKICLNHFEYDRPVEAAPNSFPQGL